MFRAYMDTQRQHLCVCKRGWDNTPPMLLAATYGDTLWSIKASFSIDANVALSKDVKRIAWSSFGKWSLHDMLPPAEVPKTVAASMDRAAAIGHPMVA